MTILQIRSRVTSFRIGLMTSADGRALRASGVVDNLPVEYYLSALLGDCGLNREDALWVEICHRVMAVWSTRTNERSSLVTCSSLRFLLYVARTCFVIKVIS